MTAEARTFEATVAFSGVFVAVKTWPRRRTHSPSPSVCKQPRRIFQSVNRKIPPSALLPERNKRSRFIFTPGSLFPRPVNGRLNSYLLSLSRRSGLLGETERTQRHKRLKAFSRVEFFTHAPLRKHTPTTIKERVNAPSCLRAWNE